MRIEFSLAEQQDNETYEISISVHPHEKRPLTIAVNPIGSTERWETILDFDLDDAIRLKSALDLFISNWGVLCKDPQ